jgi:hypothetical protein
LAGIADQIARLVNMPPARLRAEWRRLHRGQALLEGLSSDLLARSIAWRLQEKICGGLPPAQVRALARLAKQLETSGEMDLERQRQLKPGTRLVREWHGQVYTVHVLDQGYEFEDRHYASLTPIARQITGAAWSGPRFFGLKARRGKNHDPQG